MPVARQGVIRNTFPFPLERAPEAAMKHKDDTQLTAGEVMQLYGINALTLFNWLMNRMPFIDPPWSGQRKRLEQALELKEGVEGPIVPLTACRLVVTLVTNPGEKNERRETVEPFKFFNSLYDRLDKLAFFRSDVQAHLKTHWITDKPKQPQNEKWFVGYHQIHRAYNTAIETVRKWKREGAPIYPEGSHVRAEKSELDAWLQGRPKTWTQVQKRLDKKKR